MTRKPIICRLCPFGYIYYIDVEYKEPDLISKWSAEPCSRIRQRGEINPARLHYCIGKYNRACRKAKEEDAE